MNRARVAHTPNGKDERTMMARTKGISRVKTRASTTEMAARRSESTTGRSGDSCCGGRAWVDS